MIFDYVVASHDWTDVSKNNGATRILPGNHLFEHDKKVQTHISESIVQYLEGNSGSVFAVDTWALHAGNPIITSPRLVTWIRFSSMPAKSLTPESLDITKCIVSEGIGNSALTSSNLGFDLSLNIAFPSRANFISTGGVVNT